MKIILLLLLCILWGLIILSTFEKDKPLPQEPKNIKPPLIKKTPILRPKITEKLLNEPLSEKTGKFKIIVSKSQRNLLLYSGKKLLRRYPIGLGFSPINDKQKEGDGATPEGKFYVFTKNSKSAYYLSLGISYPNNEDAERGLKTGLITKKEYQKIIKAQQRKIKPPQNTALGGLIYIHGRGSKKDWTWGCVALDDRNMKELFDVIEVGTSVVIKR